MTSKIEKSQLLTLISVLTILMSCKNTDLNKGTPSISDLYKVDLSKSINILDTLSLSSIGNNIEYIPLESKASCMLKEIRQVTFSDSFIFVSDIHKLLQFDRKGNFVRQIGNKGRGPGEYMSVWDFRLDNNSEIIYITFTSSGEMLTFDFNGNFLKSFNLPNRSFHFILKDTNELMFHQPNIPGQTVDTLYSWYITDINGNTKSRIVNNVKRVRKPGYTVHDTPLYTFNNIAHFMEFGTDTLYFFDNSNKKPYAVVNFGDQKIDIDPDIQNQQVTEKLKQKFWIFSILEDRDNMYFTLCRGLGGPLVSCLFNKQSSEVTFLENNRFKNDVDGGPDFWPKEIYNDSIFIDYIEIYGI